MVKIAILLVVLSAPIAGCGPSEKELQKHQRSEDRKQKEESFYAKGMQITSEIKTEDGTLQTIEIPIKGTIPQVKRCVLFVSKGGSQTITCEEPDYISLD